MKTAIVTGGQGFLGRHLCAALVAQGYAVYSLDNLTSKNAARNFEIGDVPDIYDGPGGGRVFDIECDVVNGNDQVRRIARGIIREHGRLTEIWHFASPASPREYKADPLRCLAVNTEGTMNMCQLAHQHSARLIFASSSEVYGQPPPDIHLAIDESFLGNVSCVGPRSMYDEGKRAGEAIVTAWREDQLLDVRIPRIFNTYGPCLVDDRVVSALLRAAMFGEVFTAHANGSHARTFCYVADLVRQLMILRDSERTLPTNVGGEDYRTVAQLVGEVSKILLELGDDTPIQIHWDVEPQDEHDPITRRPDLSAIKSLGYDGPWMDLHTGLFRTAAWMANQREKRTGKKW